MNISEVSFSVSLFTDQFSKSWGEKSQYFSCTGHNQSIDYRPSQSIAFPVSCQLKEKKFQSVIKAYNCKRWVLICRYLQSAEYLHNTYYCSDAGTRGGGGHWPPNTWKII